MLQKLQTALVQEKPGNTSKVLLKASIFLFLVNRKKSHTQKKKQYIKKILKWIPLI